MNEKLKQIDKKYLFIFGGILGSIVLIVIIAIIIRILLGPGNNYAKLEQKMVSAAEKYMNSGDYTKPEKGESIVISTETLISEGYLKELNKYIEDTCTGTITVINNNGLALYLPDLKCSEYATIKLSTQIIDDNLVVSDKQYANGLYEENGEYIFKGRDVNNYVSFGGQTWRILKIDSDGKIRLINNTVEKKKIRWDYKHNAEVNKNYGKNDYENSDLLITLNISYNKFKDQNKKHLVSHDVCVGKRELKNYDIDLSIDCSSVLENQYISTINSVDYAMASLDENCTSIDSGSCRNYNYLSSSFTVSWSTIAISNNTYEVLLIGGGYVNEIRADKKYNYYWVIYVSGDELYKTGNGTITNPYVIN